MDDQPPTKSNSSPVRMVIRARVEPEPEVAIPAAQWHIPRIVSAALALAALIGVVWFGIRTLSSNDSGDARATVKSPSAATATERIEPRTTPSSEASSATPSDSKPASTSASSDATPAPSVIEPSGVAVRDAPLSVVAEVSPDVSQQALNTIRGTVRVILGVTIDPNGRVVVVRARSPGPSRYFERASRAAVERWNFSPSNTHAPRTALVRFHYTRAGVVTSFEAQGVGSDP